MPKCPTLGTGADAGDDFGTGTRYTRGTKCPVNSGGDVSAKRRLNSTPTTIESSERVEGPRSASLLYSDSMPPRVVPSVTVRLSRNGQSGRAPFSSRGRCCAPCRSSSARTARGPFSRTQELDWRHGFVFADVEATLTPSGFSSLTSNIHDRSGNAPRYCRPASTRASSLSPIGHAPLAREAFLANSPRCSWSRRSSSSTSSAATGTARRRAACRGTCFFRSLCFARGVQADLRPHFSGRLASIIRLRTLANPGLDRSKADG